MHLENDRWLLDFDDTTGRPYGYLLLDDYFVSEKDERILKEIISGQRLTVFCCEKDNLKKLRHQ